MLEFSDVNYWAVAVATLINTVLGAFWYSPKGFGKAWTKLTGVDMMKMPKDEANKAIAMVAVGAVVQTVVLAAVITSLNITELVDGVVAGVVLWAGFTAATSLGDALYARRGLKFWWLNNSFFLVVMTVNAAILAIWS